MPHFAANLSMMFTEHGFLDRFQAAADAGFDAVEFQFPYEFRVADIAARSTAAGVEVVLFNLPPGDWEAGERGLAALPGRRAAFDQSVGTGLDYAAALGTKRLHVMAGIGNPADAATVAAYVASLNHAADAAAEAGVMLMIEPINGRDMPGYFLNDFDQAVALIDRLGRSNIALQFDIYHRQILRGDVLSGLEQLLPVIGHVQIASVPGRNEPGSGELDDFRVLAALDRLGYRGLVGCEYRPAGSTLTGLGWRERLASGS